MYDLFFLFKIAIIATIVSIVSNCDRQDSFFVFRIAIITTIAIPWGHLLIDDFFF